MATSSLRKSEETGVHTVPLAVGIMWQCPLRSLKKQCNCFEIMSQVFPCWPQTSCTAWDDLELWQERLEEEITEWWIKFPTGRTEGDGAHPTTYCYMRQRAGLSASLTVLFHLYTSWQTLGRASAHPHLQWGHSNGGTLAHRRLLRSPVWLHAHTLFLESQHTACIFTLLILFVPFLLIKISQWQPFTDNKLEVKIRGHCNCVWVEKSLG